MGSRSQRLVRVIAIAAGLGFCIAVSFTRPFTGRADVITALALLVMLVAQIVAAKSRIFRGILGNSRRGRASLASCLPWIVVTAVVVAFELFNYFSLPRSAHPTLSSLADSLSSSHAGKAVLCFAWLGLGVLLLRRRPEALGGAGE